MRFYPAMLLALGLLGACAAHARTDEFLTNAIKGDNSEARLGRLAAERGASSAARKEAVQVARRHHVTPPTAMMDEAQKEYRKLQGLRGRDFDREFARYMVDDHKKDIAEFEKEVRSGDPADVRALARKTLPVLRKHLKTAESLT
jgi:putative membrane protein